MGVHTHECEWPGCQAEVANERFLCSGHWRRVPRENQRAVYATWNARLRARGTGMDSARAAKAEHDRAKQEALVAAGAGL